MGAAEWCIIAVIETEVVSVRHLAFLRAKTSGSNFLRSVSGRNVACPLPRKERGTAFPGVKAESISPFGTLLGNAVMGVKRTQLVWEVPPPYKRPLAGPDGNSS